MAETMLYVDRSSGKPLRLIDSLRAQTNDATSFEVLPKPINTSEKTISHRLLAIDRSKSIRISELGQGLYGVPIDRNKFLRAYQ